MVRALPRWLQGTARARAADRRQNGSVSPSTAAPPPFAVLAALAAELEPLTAHARARRRVQGLELLDLEFGGTRAVACAAGVGKVNAAHAAATLLAESSGAGLFIVGVCGGLRRGLVPGTLVHCTRAVQTDSSLRQEREVESDATLREAWQRAVAGEAGWFLTADRPVLSLWRRLRLARAFLGPCVADMETAAAAAVARRAGVPWAALRAVTDQATAGALASFHVHFPVQAGRAAASLPGLLPSLRAGRNSAST